jgi:uncharacterized repeat protein (TIGR03843 family)
VTAAPTDVEERLATGTLTVEGRVITASNLTMYARVDADDGSTLSCVYKPVSGERPLWDFPDGTLAARERVAYLVSEVGGWHLIPATVLRDGPLGPGMCQQWVTGELDQPPDDGWVDLLDGAADMPGGWIAVLSGVDHAGREVTLAHRDEGPLRSLALLDAVLNNADRKGGHLLTDRDGRLWGVDHGLCCHAEPKLRTVLWGWRSARLSQAELDQLESLHAWLAGDPAELGALLTSRERRALRDRVDTLRETAVFPEPVPGLPALPWPAF